ncbi:MAG: Methyltransferase [Pedosphaera sp.]|nr:Methyltransferase [Pedosphaera sp.]
MNQTRIAEQELGEVELMRENFRRDVLKGFSRPVKSLPCKYFYDQEGARLFEMICELEEYYPTRTEVGILRRKIKEIAPLPGPDCSLVELGSGSCVKTRLLLDHLDRPACYVPVDVARTQLLECSANLAQDYADMEVLPVCADYTNHFELPNFPPISKRTVVFFPGSTIGNFEPDEAERFLQRIVGLCGTEGGLLIGVDLKKDPRVLHAAYNDARGVTAAFNLNVLTRANRELDARFDLSQFQHQAFYNQTAGRVEMHLVSRRRQVIPVSGMKFFFAEGESIITEYSYKYGRDEFHQLAARAGWAVRQCWTDENDWFGVYYLVPHAPESH